MKYGELVRWTTANGTRYGSVCGRHPLGYVVRTDGGKKIVATAESLTIISNTNENENDPERSSRP